MRAGWWWSWQRGEIVSFRQVDKNKINILLVQVLDLSLSAKDVTNVEKEKTRMNLVELIGIGHIHVN